MHGDKAGNTDNLETKRRLSHLFGLEGAQLGNGEQGDATRLRHLRERFYGTWVSRMTLAMLDVAAQESLT